MAGGLLQQIERSTVRKNGQSGGFMKAAADAFETGRIKPGKGAASRYAEVVGLSLTKGYGLHRERGLNPSRGMSVQDTQRDTISDTKAAKLTKTAIATHAEVIRCGLYTPEKALKGFCKPYRNSLKSLMRYSPQALSIEQNNRQISKLLSAELGKSFDLTTPLSTGFVPFDLMPFVRTIYPVYTVMRNKLARVPGQGTIHRGKILYNISGSLPGNLGTLQTDATSEFFGGSGFAEWPNPLPASGVQDAYDIEIPNRFYALTEGVSWLAQFAGQGFDDIYGLASLVLLQEFMLAEEHDMLASTATPLAVPAAPTCTARAATSAETPLSGVSGGTVYIGCTSLNYWGETVISAITTVAVAAGQVVDVVSDPTAASLGHGIYIDTGATDPGTYYRMAVTGATTFTLQGAIPVTGATPPVADTGTGSTLQSESLISVLSGWANTNQANGTYPTAATAGDYQGHVNDTLNISVLNNALHNMYNGGGTGGSGTGYFANPSEIICEAEAAITLSNDIRMSGENNYLLQVAQSEVAGAKLGVAVSNVVNPITRSLPEILVHPYMAQGNALLMSYTLPTPQSTLGNVVEMVMVQDYAQIGWPVIDPTFRQSILRYGQLFFPAPQYCGLLQGLQASAAPPFS